MFVAENTTINVSKFLPVSSSIVRLVGIRLWVMLQKWISDKKLFYGGRRDLCFSEAIFNIWARIWDNISKDISFHRMGFLFLRDSSLWHFFELLTQLSQLPSFELLLSSLEPFFEWPTQLSPLLSKTSQLSTILSKSTRLSTFLSAQKSKFTLESPFLSGFTLLSAFLSAQKSAQATSQPLW